MAALLLVAGVSMQPSVAQNVEKVFSAHHLLSCGDLEVLAGRGQGGRLLVAGLAVTQCAAGDPSSIVSIPRARLESALSSAKQRARATASATNPGGYKLDFELDAVLHEFQSRAQSTLSMLAGRVRGKPIKPLPGVTELEIPEERVARFVGLMGPFLASASDLDARVNELALGHEQHSSSELIRRDVAIVHCVQIAQSLENIEQRTAEQLEDYVRPCYTAPNEGLELRRSELAKLHRGEPRSLGLDMFGFRMSRIVKANDALFDLRHREYTQRQREAQERAARLEEARKAEEERRLAREREAQAVARSAEEARARQEAEERRRAALTPEQRAAEDRIAEQQARRVHAMRCEMLQLALARVIDEGSATKVMAIRMQLDRQGCR
jgi:hypothetical protein